MRQMDDRDAEPAVEDQKDNDAGKQDGDNTDNRKKDGEEDDEEDALRDKTAAEQGQGQ